MQSQPLIRKTLDLAATADVAFVGVGEIDDTAPLFLDGFLSRHELSDLRAAGAVGEICGWLYDAEGRVRDIGRTASAPLPPRDHAVVIALAKGRKKLPALRAAVRGGFVNALITDEATAEALLAERA
jgi:DNA-binding transcriptional regulator LsrR (DeoR family)